MAAIASNPDEFEGFYREYLPVVRVYLARRVSDPYDAADLTADVFLRTIRVADTYRPDLGSPRAWLIGITRHVLADHWRSSARQRAAVARLGGRRLLDDDSCERIVQQISAEAEARRLLDSIAELPEPLRAVVELVAVDELSLNDASRILGISPGNARIRYHRARRALRTTSAPHIFEVTS